LRTQRCRESDRQTPARRKQHCSGGAGAQGAGAPRRDAVSVTLTAAGLEYDTGLSDRFVAASDH
jgi:hypothetical protein